MQSLYQTLDTIKADLTLCGENLQEANKHFNITLFEISNRGIYGVYGLDKSFIDSALLAGKNQAVFNVIPEFFIEGEEVLIYNTIDDCFEFNTIKKVKGSILIFEKPFKNNYRKGSNIVVIKRIEYKFYPLLKVLKRKNSGGKFQPLLKKVTHLSITHFKNSRSVYLGIEYNRGAKIRGYSFLAGM
jgi:hypothetical protein